MGVLKVKQNGSWVDIPMAGPPGPPGPQGIQGIQGTPGPAGATTAAGYFSSAVVQGAIPAGESVLTPSGGVISYGFQIVGARVKCLIAGIYRAALNATLQPAAGAWVICTIRQYRGVTNLKTRDIVCFGGNAYMEGVVDDIFDLQVNDELAFCVNPDVARAIDGRSVISISAVSTVGPQGSPGPQGVIGPAGPMSIEGSALPEGGEIRNVLVKNSATDGDVRWESHNDLYAITGRFRRRGTDTPAAEQVTYVNGVWCKFDLPEVAVFDLPGHDGINWYVPYKAMFIIQIFMWVHPGPGLRTFGLSRDGADPWGEDSRLVVNPNPDQGHQAQTFLFTPTHAGEKVQIAYWHNSGSNFTTNTYWPGEMTVVQLGRMH